MPPAAMLTISESCLPWLLQIRGGCSVYNAAALAERCGASLLFAGTLGDVLSVNWAPKRNSRLVHLTVRDGRKGHLEDTSPSLELDTLSRETGVCSQRSC